MKHSSFYGESTLLSYDQEIWRHRRTTTTRQMQTPRSFSRIQEFTGHTVAVAAVPAVRQATSSSTYTAPDRCDFIDCLFVHQQPGGEQSFRSGTWISVRTGAEPKEFRSRVQLVSLRCLTTKNFNCVVTTSETLWALNCRPQIPSPVQQSRRICSTPTPLRGHL